MLDRLAENPLLEADVADVDARERIGRLAEQHLLEVHERFVVLLLEHLRPAEERLGLRITGGELIGLGQRFLRTGMIAERQSAPPLFDEGGGADVVGHHDGLLTGELRRERRVGGKRFPLVDERLDVVLEGGEIGDLLLDGAEEADDFTLERGHVFGRLGRLEAGVDGAVLGLVGREVVVRHGRCGPGRG